MDRAVRRLAPFPFPVLAAAPFPVFREGGSRSTACAASPDPRSSASVPLFPLASRYDLTPPPAAPARCAFTRQPTEQNLTCLRRCFDSILPHRAHRLWGRALQLTLASQRVLLAALGALPLSLLALTPIPLGAARVAVEVRHGGGAGRARVP